MIFLRSISPMISCPLLRRKKVAHPYGTR